MDSVFEQIKKRYSVRTYLEKDIEASVLKAFDEYVQGVHRGPFQNEVRLMIVDGTGVDKAELRKLGTYSYIKGPRVFLSGSVKKSEYAMEDFGYCMEGAILKATELGLGTCWLGGTLNRSVFAQKMKLGEDELIPSVTPIGYASEEPWLIDRFVRGMSKGATRKDFSTLFFKDTLSQPLTESDCGVYFKALKAVQLAPSASNKQPWRIVKESDAPVFHFYLKENYLYNHIMKDIKIQNVDMGIAMCHFELVASELGLKGGWKMNDKAAGNHELKYIISWTGENL